MTSTRSISKYCINYSWQVHVVYPRNMTNTFITDTVYDKYTQYIHDTVVYDNYMYYIHVLYPQYMTQYMTSRWETVENAD